MELAKVYNKIEIAKNNIKDHWIFVEDNEGNYWVMDKKGIIYFFEI